ncbi:MAG TPA: NADPH:quinone reductase [Candidatus Limnocylindrales bacterium]|nr:NADPH:quinone reductase [Candidatus Limnocylindrales bacterium]
MRVASYDRTGPARDVLVIAEAPLPSPSAGEVLIRMRASGVNPADVRRRGGWAGSGFSAVSRRVIPHTDGAGVIEALGDEVDASWLGARVWLWNAGGASFYGFPDEGTDVGTAAEYVALPVRFVSRLPDAASFEAGACMGGPGCTAHYVVFADGDVSGATILVQGGTGAVGELSTQLARRAGATVIATVGSPDKIARAKAAGAEHVIDRSKDDVAAAVLAVAPSGVDRIIEVEFGLNVGVDAKIIKPNGTIATYSSPTDREPVLPYYELQRKGVRVRFVQAYILTPTDRARSIDGVNAGLANGSLRPTIAARFPLERIAESHEFVESRKGAGNVVVTM